MAATKRTAAACAPSSPSDRPASLTASAQPQISSPWPGLVLEHQNGSCKSLGAP
jgi:hypothetical protein